MNVNYDYEIDRTSSEYLEYRSIAQKIFSKDSIKEFAFAGDSPYFDVQGSYFFENCKSSILQYDCVYLYIPQKLIYDGNSIFPAKTNTNIIATTTDDLVAYYKPSKELFTEKCYYLLHLIKEMQNYIKLSNINKDFQ